MNSSYEALGPGDEPVLALDEWMERVECSDPCETHPWLRAQWALYMLYTQHFIEQAGWQAFPEYSEEQENVLLTFMFDLVVDETQPFLVRAEVANKLPTTNLPGAPDLVEELKSYFIGKESLTSEESDLLTYLNQ